MHGATAASTRAWLWVYRCWAWAMLGPVLGWLWYRGLREPAYRERLRERLGRIEVQPDGFHGVLVHAASVGEARAAQPLVQALLRDHPTQCVTLSCVTPTGAATLKSLWGERVRQVLWPLDTPGACGEFLDRLQPRLLVLVERETWPEMLTQCRQRGIAVAVVNARMSERSARGYQRLRGLMRPIWSQLSLVAAADTADAQRLRALGVPAEALHVCGNLKFDVPAAATPAGLPDLSARYTVIAGSTHAAEEMELLDGWPTFLQARPDALLVIAPRHPQRFHAVAELLRQHRVPHALRSEGTAIGPATQVLLLDTMGELPVWYAQAQLVLVGGTLAPVGGHNPMEALRCGVPTFFGLHTRHFEPLCSQIVDAGAGARVADAHAFWRAAVQLSQDPPAASAMGQRALDFFRANAGATARTWTLLQPLLPPPVTHRTCVTSRTADTLWFDPSLWPDAQAQDLTPPAPPEITPHCAASSANRSGRGQVQRVLHHGQPMLLRHYRRGGWIARLCRDSYAACAPHQSRAMREFALLQYMRACDLPVPSPVAARQRRLWGRYTADILIGWIADARNVAECLSERRLGAHEWHTLGRAIRRLHDRGIDHTDLNCHNLMLDAQGQAWIVDFDKCGLRGPGAWPEQNLQRLLRSLRKEQNRRPGFQWAEEDWADLLSGYKG